MSFSNILEIAGITDIGEQLLRSDFEPFLNTGETLATFHSSVNISEAIDSLKMHVNEGATMSAANFSSLHGMLSRPVAFLLSILFNSLQTLWASICWKEKDLLVWFR